MRRHYSWLERTGRTLDSGLPQWWLQPPRARIPSSSSPSLFPAKDKTGNSAKTSSSFIYSLPMGDEIFVGTFGAGWDWP